MNNPTQVLKIAGLPPPGVHNRIVEKIDETMEKAQWLFPTHELTTPTLSYDLKGHVAGKAYSNLTKQTFNVKINVDLLWDERYLEDMIDDTVPHEVAHIICAQVYGPNIGHGSEWKRLMWRLDLDGNRTHEYETTPARKRKRMARPYHYSCSCPSTPDKPQPRWHLTKILHRRMQQGQKRYCPECKSYLKEVTQ